MISRLLIFGILNFGALAIGGFFTGSGVNSEWYSNLNKAPWTPPGWVFGFAWTTIMICYTYYMASAWGMVKAKPILILLFSLQWILNTMWNPVFFHYRNTELGMIVITLLTVIVGVFLFYYKSEMKYLSLLVLPYFIWLIVATSLNGYILVKN